MRAFDDTFREEGVDLICGIDEAGRGPLAGPVVAAAVVFARGQFIEGVNDSKKLSPTKRNALTPLIKQTAAAHSVALVGPDIIDELNILHASLKAMRNSLEQLPLAPHLILVDGNKLFTSSVPAFPVVRGDSKSFAIASASILAKVTRDAIMERLHEEYPVYNWRKNKGYPTREHISAVLQYGPTPLHRKTFLKNIELWKSNGLFD